MQFAVCQNGKNKYFTLSESLSDSLLIAGYVQKSADKTHCCWNLSSYTTLQQNSTPYEVRVLIMRHATRLYFFGVPFTCPSKVQSTKPPIGVWRKDLNQTTVCVNHQTLSKIRKLTCLNNKKYYL